MSFKNESQPDVLSGNGPCRCHTRNHARLVAIILLSCLAFNGCVFRRITIRSDPPNALALVDGEEIGYTPVSLDHVYYGTREITLVKPGYETLTVMQKLETPWYQTLGIDFIADNLSPVKITDRSEFNYSLQKQFVVGNQELIERANSHRQGLQNQSMINTH